MNPETMLIVWRKCGHEVEYDGDGVVVPCSSCAKETCTNCGKTGHWRPDCPTTSLELKIARATTRVKDLKSMRLAARGERDFDAIDETYESAKEELQELLDEQMEKTE